jgi:HSP20 family protein
MTGTSLQTQRGWDPFSELGRLQEEVNRLFDVTGFGKPFLAYRERSFPLMNVVSNDHESFLVAEIPGVEMKDLDITITGTTLTIKGERRLQQAVPEEKYYRRERGAGVFGRSLELPHKVDVEKVEATLKDGILMVRLPKAPEVKPRKIEVRA